MKSHFHAILALIALVVHVSAFAPNHITSSPSFISPLSISSVFQKHQTSYVIESKPLVLRRQRQSMAPVSSMGLFGLGAPEIAVILVAAAFLLGPQKLAELGKDAGRIAGELKEVPKEFQAGIAEGEKEAAKMKAEIEAKSPTKSVEAEKTE